MRATPVRRPGGGGRGTTTFRGARVSIIARVTLIGIDLVLSLPDTGTGTDSPRLLSLPLILILQCLQDSLSELDTLTDCNT